MRLLLISDNERWLALMPSGGVEMMLVPFEQAPWSGGRIQSSQLVVKFDDDGRLQDGRWAVELGPLFQKPELNDSLAVPADRPRTNLARDPG